MGESHDLDIPGIFLKISYDRYIYTRYIQVMWHRWSYRWNIPGTYHEFKLSGASRWRWPSSRRLTRRLQRAITRDTHLYQAAGSYREPVLLVRQARPGRARAFITCCFRCRSPAAVNLLGPKYVRLLCRAGCYALHDRLLLHASWTYSLSQANILSSSTLQASVAATILLFG